jgi:hypothetical protein
VPYNYHETFAVPGKEPLKKKENGQGTVGRKDVLPSICLEDIRETG